MLSKRDVLTRESGQRRHLLLETGIVQAIDGDQQDVLPAPHIAVVQVAQRILNADGFRVTLLDKTALVLLRI